MARKIQGFGWIRDLPDPRDRVFAAQRPLNQALPAKVDLRQDPAMSFPIYDQGQLGSCTANAIAAALDYMERKNAETSVNPSRLFIYYCERALEGSTSSDSGAQIRDGAKVVATTGYPPEDEWQYDIAQFATKPPANVYEDAKRDVVTTYYRVQQTLAMLQACLAEGFPFVGGISVFSSFPMSPDQGGDVPMPSQGDQPEGGHAILFVGYDAATQRFTFRNSWGDGWGDGGYGTVPFAYLTDASLSADFWTLRKGVTG